VNRTSCFHQPERNEDEEWTLAQDAARRVAEHTTPEAASREAVEL
jgi:hypothetical protein